METKSTAEIKRGPYSIPPKPNEPISKLWTATSGFKPLIAKARQEAHVCNSSPKVLEWIDWFEKELEK